MSSFPMKQRCSFCQSQNLGISDRLGNICSRRPTHNKSGDDRPPNNLCTLDIGCQWVGLYVKWLILSQHIRCVYAKKKIRQPFFHIYKPIATSNFSHFMNRGIVGFSYSISNVSSAPSFSSCVGAQRREEPSDADGDFYNLFVGFLCPCREGICIKDNNTYVE